jgi:hypothetical protein
MRKRPKFLFDFRKRHLVLYASFAKETYILKEPTIHCCGHCISEYIQSNSPDKTNHIES